MAWRLEAPSVTEPAPLSQANFANTALPNYPLAIAIHARDCDPNSLPIEPMLTVESCRFGTDLIALPDYSHPKNELTQDCLC